MLAIQPSKRLGTKELKEQYKAHVQKVKHMSKVQNHSKFLEHTLSLQREWREKGAKRRARLKALGPDYCHPAHKNDLTARSSIEDKDVDVPTFSRGTLLKKRKPADKDKQLQLKKPLAQKQGPLRTLPDIH